MEKYYFTFGSWKKFPYQNTYLVVVASSYRDAVKEFRKKHPDVNPGCMNCSDCYSEEQWKEVGYYYADQRPAEVIWTERCFGQKPEGYDDLFIFVPEMKQIVRISEGTGNNLLPEDQAQGYVDYIYYEQYELSNDMPEIDGGQIMLKEMLQDKYKCMADCIQDVLSMAYGSDIVNCMILS
ncbi:MAG: hypothetical protein NC347_00170 [Clostridium sp.]|nr:hypothetical protein [Clostridium sp.]